MLSNITQHPKTSIAGLLIAITTVCGVLLGQGVTFGNLGKGSVVTLVSALATALLGLLAKDPNAVSIPSSSMGQKLGAWMLIALLMPIVFLAGCTNWERTTYQTLAASQATINQAQADYESKTIAQTEASFTTINAAKTTQTAAVNQFVAYEELKATNAGASQLSVAETQVVAAITQLPTVIAQVKALYAGGK